MSLLVNRRRHEDVPPRGRDELLLLSGRGDTEAFAQLYDDLAPTVFGLATLLTPDQETALDVSYRAFLALWEAAPSFDPRQGSATLWIAKEVRRQALNAAS